MTDKTITTIQIGKSGYSEGTLETIKKAFKTHKNVKISVLKSAIRDKEEMKKMSDEILEKLGDHYTGRIIGYTLIVKKWRKPREKRKNEFGIIKTR